MPAELLSAASLRKADRRYWQELCDLIPGWRIYGWGYRSGATFTTDIGSMLELTARQRDQIVAAIQKGKGSAR